MDMFKLLSRGATIHQKQKQELAKFTGQQEKQADLNQIDQKIDFFATNKRQPNNNTENFEEITDFHRITTPQQAIEFRARNKTKVTGDAPLPIASFEDLVERYQINHKIKRNLKIMNFEKPTPIQSETLPILLTDHDLLAVAPTGSGKTLAFVAPILQLLLSKTGSKQCKALFVSPTRELTSQIYEVATKLAKSTNVVVGHLNKKMLAKLRQSNLKLPHIIVSTPMRLLEACKEQLISLNEVEFVVFDEADKLLSDEFSEQTDKILSLLTSKHLVKSFFSATMPSHIEQLAKSVLSSQMCRVIVGHKEGASQQIEQKLVYCGNENGKLIAIRQALVGGGYVPPILVFVQSIARAKALFNELLYDKINVDVIHSELTQHQRQHVVNQFKQGDVWVLICTDVLARGIDFQGVNLVINYDIPLNAQSYVHRIGRTGRAGKQGVALTYYTKQDIVSLKPIVNVMKQSGVEVGEWLMNAANNPQSVKKHSKIPLKRQEISTVPKAVKQKARERREMVEASKRKRQRA